MYLPSELNALVATELILSDYVNFVAATLALSTATRNKTREWDGDLRCVAAAC